MLGLCQKWGSMLLCADVWLIAADITVTETVNKKNEMIYIVYSLQIVTCTLDILVQ